MSKELRSFGGPQDLLLLVTQALFISIFFFYVNIYLYFCVYKLLLTPLLTYVIFLFGFVFDDLGGRPGFQSEDVQWWWDHGWGGLINEFNDAFRRLIGD